MTRLGFGVKIDGNNLTVKVPLYREDMEDYPDIAEEIIRLKKRLIFLGGPSSSGKTTSSRKLSLYLNSLGKKTIKISKLK
mgnify:CR=1 FL=1